MNRSFVPLTALGLALGACSLLLDEDSLSPVNGGGAGGGSNAGAGRGGGGSGSDDGGAGNEPGVEAGATGSDAGSVGTGGSDGGTSGGGNAGGATDAGEGGEPSCAPGSLACACGPNGSCDSGLVCVEAECRVQIGCSPATVLDDLEDQDRVICPNQGRNGVWFVFAASTTGTITPATGSALRPTSIASAPRPSSDSRWAMRLSGSGFGDVAGSDYAALSFSFFGENGVTLGYDLSAHQGIAFWAKSDVPVKMRFNLTTIPSRSVAQSGTCTGSCNDHFGAFFDVTPTWTRFTVPFATMTQQGWGKVVPKDVAQAYSADFMYVGKYEGTRLNHDNPSAFDLQVDDVELY